MTITANGTHYFPLPFQAGRLCVMDICGSSFGGGTVTPGFLAADGGFSPFLKADGTAVTIAARGGYQARVARNGQLGIQLAGATAPAITLDVLPAVDMPPGS